ncbi:benzoate 4-monooxygenase cytochrome P450 [Desulfovibrio ferrophilus]|uniref:Benzoate 4-monooxygenase cytochrome P450 n=1 Tax=Desulfovibrio ferrophilus TaxID=241368 RepID=A0A2Z6AVS6_9BACT|nr:benzoate 4-monooxygenase cytochrome P450 [Desulfovibrio ferrophilus]
MTYIVNRLSVDTAGEEDMITPKLIGSTLKNSTSKTIVVTLVGSWIGYDLARYLYSITAPRFPLETMKIERDD